MEHKPFEKSGPPADSIIKLEEKRELRIGSARISSYSLEGAIDPYSYNSSYRLIMCWPEHAMGSLNFRDRWGPHQFERLGDIFLMPPEHAVQVKAGACVRKRIFEFEFDVDAVRDWFGGGVNWTHQRLKACLDIVSPNIRGSLRRIAEEMRNPGFASDTFCELLADQTAIDLARFCDAANSIKPSGGLTPRRLKLIDERLAETGPAPDLNELANLCNLSVRQLTRAFRTSRGCSIGVFLAENRVNHAKQLLGGPESIQEISASMGFKSPANFSSAFRRATGESPRKFRERTGWIS